MHVQDYMTSILILIGDDNMLWNIIDKKKFCLYINNDIDLIVKVCDVDDKTEVHMNYKGYNLTMPMLVWEFGSVLEFASIYDVSIEGESMNRKYFIIDKNDKERFLNEMYFFLVDNNMDTVLRDTYQVDCEFT